MLPPPLRGCSPWIFDPKQHDGWFKETWITDQKARGGRRGCEGDEEEEDEEDEKDEEDEGDLGVVIWGAIGRSWKSQFRGRRAVDGPKNRDGP